MSYSRRLILSTSITTGIGILSGCMGSISSLGTQNSEQTIPILIENQSNNTYDVGVQIWATENEDDLTITVDPEETVEVRTVEGEFCIRMDIPTEDNMKDTICPSPEEKDYSEAGYKAIIHSNSKDRNKRLEIQPIS